MPETPEQIQRQIEDTRAELASTVELIADRVSPKKVAGRGAAAARAKVEGFFVQEVPAEGAGEHGTRRQVRWERVGAAAGGLVVLLLLRHSGKKRAAAAPRKATLKAAASAAAKARKEQQKAPAELTGRAAARADRTRLELEAAVADLQNALASQPAGH